MSSPTKKVGLCFACWNNTSAKSNFAMVCAITFEHTPMEIPKPLTFGMRSSRPQVSRFETRWIHGFGKPVTQ